MGRRKSRCSHCYEYGHTKRGCKQYKDYLQKEINAGSYWAQTEYQKVTQTKCSHCKIYGHNRRACQDRKDEIQTHTDDIHAARLKIREKLSEIGLGPGALLQYETAGWVEHEGYVRRDVVGPLLDVNWESVSQYNEAGHQNFHSTHPVVKVYHTQPAEFKDSSSAEKSGAHDVSWPLEYVGEGEARRNTPTLVSPSYVGYDDKWFTTVECNKTAVAMVDAEFNRKKKG